MLSTSVYSPFLSCSPVLHHLQAPRCRFRIRAPAIGSFSVLMQRSASSAILRRHFKGSRAWVAFNHLYVPVFCAFASLNLAWRTLPPFFFLVPVVQQTLVRIVYNPILQYNLYPLQYFLFGTYCNYCMSKSYASAFMPMTPYSGLVEPGPQIEKQALEQGTRLG